MRDIGRCQLPAAGWMSCAPRADARPFVIGLILVPPSGVLRRALQTHDGLCFEDIFSHGTEHDPEVAATGFLEALVSAIDHAPEREWTLALAGPRSRDPILAWDLFYGINRPPGPTAASPGP